MGVFRFKSAIATTSRTAQQHHGTHRMPPMWHRVWCQGAMLGCTLGLVGLPAAIAIAAPQPEADHDTHPQNQKYQTTAGVGLTHISAPRPSPSTPTQNATSTTTPRPRMAQTDTSVEHLRDRAPVSLQAAELRPQTPSVKAPSPMAPELAAEDQPTPNATDPQGDTAPPNQNNLAQESQNPIGDLISLPFQFNFNFGVGPFDKTQLVVNIQPVVPISLGPNWTLVTRTIIPLVNQPTVAVRAPSMPDLPPTLESDYKFGLGDINPQLFFVPKGTGKVNWGIGPQFIFPTATADATGTGKWSVGPTGVIVYTSGPWVLGTLVNQVWSFAGDSDRRAVSQLLIQPFINYNLPKGWYLSTSPAITANWMADRGNKWTVPLGGGFGRVFTIGTQPVNAGLRAYWNVVKPDGAADWTLQFQFTFLFPK